MTDESEPSVLLAGWFEVEPEEREAFIEQNLDHMMSAQNEPGCVAFVLSADPSQLSHVQVFEHWKTRRDFESHQEVIRSRPRSQWASAVKKRELVTYDAVRWVAP